jgi:hypothetical protein
MLTPLKGLKDARGPTMILMLKSDGPATPKN